MVYRIKCNVKRKEVAVDEKAGALGEQLFITVTQRSVTMKNTCSGF
jgi:hypothetical protein